MYIFSPELQRGNINTDTKTPFSFVTKFINQGVLTINRGQSVIPSRLSIRYRGYFPATINKGLREYQLSHPDD
jgi:hypothetical protein